MAINDTTQLSVQGTVTGQNHVHTLHFRYLRTSANEQDLIDMWQANCRTAYRAMFSPADSPVEMLTARQVCGSLPLRAPAQEIETAGNIAGTVSGYTQALPPHDAVVVSIRTANAGKRYRGRNYIGGLNEVETNSGVIEAGVKTRTTAYFNTLLTLFGPTGSNLDYRWRVHSPTLAAIPAIQCQDAGADVTTFIVRDQIGTMRSRKIGRGS